MMLPNAVVISVDIITNAIFSTYKIPYPTFGIHSVLTLLKNRSIGALTLLCQYQLTLDKSETIIGYNYLAI